MPLSPLLANKSVERILYYLLVNHKCYPTQLSRCFNSPLTPLQQAMQQLESEGVLVSSYEGKIRVFEFNSNYPLLKELEELLKKAYYHLDFQEKKLYYKPHFHTFKKKQGYNLQDNERVLHKFWEKLAEIQQISLSAQTRSFNRMGWNGLGKGSVEIDSPAPQILIFNENGKWISQKEQSVEFRNVFRWTFTKSNIQLEHLRFGPRHPVFLFKLKPVDAMTLESIEPHICKEDIYFGKVRFDHHYIQLNWRVIGPIKNEEIDYLYT